MFPWEWIKAFCCHPCCKRLIDHYKKLDEIKCSPCSSSEDKLITLDAILLLHIHQMSNYISSLPGPSKQYKIEWKQWKSHRRISAEHHPVQKHSNSIRVSTISNCNDLGSNVPSLSPLCSFPFNFFLRHLEKVSFWKECLRHLSSSKIA